MAVPIHNLAIAVNGRSGFDGWMRFTVAAPWFTYQNSNDD
jgi:hypothetical protein